MFAIQPHYGGQAPLPISSYIDHPYSSNALHTSSTNFPSCFATCEALDEPTPIPQVDTVPFDNIWSNDKRIPFEKGQSTDCSQDVLSELDSIWEEERELPTSLNALPGNSSMRAAKTKAGIGILSTLITYVSLNSLFKALNPDAFIWQDEDREESSWLATSHSWFDRKACRWLSLCGTAHFRRVRSRFGTHAERKQQSPLEAEEDDVDWAQPWTEGKTRPEDWTDDDRRLREIPDYVMEYAPLVHLYSGEQFWPCDIAEHLFHTTPHLNYTPVLPGWQHPKLSDLDKLNQWERGRNVFLTSNDNVEGRPDWLEGQKNIPNNPPKDPSSEAGEAWAEWDGRVDGGLPEDPEGDLESWYDVGEDSTRDQGGNRGSSDGPAHIPTETPEGEDFVLEDRPKKAGISDELKHRRSDLATRKRSIGGRSDAPAVLIVVDKGHGIIDAFWFYFYSFNLGNVVLNVRFGNHVGDWEHSMVRFHHGKPKAIYFSEHSFGDAYRYEAVEKIGKRPVIYSATGTHAMYPTPGTHAYILPWGLLHDETDRGPLWDPALNSHSYTYDYINDNLRPSNFTPNAPTEWFFFNGHWGDKFYPLSDSRQYRFAGQYHYVNGPLGPRFKNLGRRKVCGGSAKDPCNIRNWIDQPRRLRRWQGPGEGEEASEVDLSNASQTTEDHR